MKHFELSQDEDTGIQWYCDNPNQDEPITIWNPKWNPKVLGRICIASNDAILDREQAGELAEILKKFSETGELPIILESQIAPPIGARIFVLPGF